MSTESFHPGHFIGSFHPMLVHLPIGFLLLLVVLEALRLLPRFKSLAVPSGPILVLSAAVAIGSAVSGWLLAESGGYDEKLLGRHRWFGIGVAGATVVLLGVHWLGCARAYRVLLGVTAILLVVTGHLGGSLTHGSDYLAQHAPGWLRPLLGGNPSTGIPAGDPVTSPIYAAAIQPLLTRYCVSCHGPKKIKAKLRLDTLERLLKGGESGPVVDAGQPDQSLLLKRLMLPLDDDDHMPPDGKPQPSEAEIALLRWWIEIGAPTDKSAQELNAPEAILGTLRSKPKSSETQD